MQKLEVTGLFLRVEREGKWESIDISDLYEHEIEKAFEGKDPRQLIKWIALLARSCRNLGGLIILAGEGREPKEIKTG